MASLPGIPLDAALLGLTGAAFVAAFVVALVPWRRLRSGPAAMLLSVLGSLALVALGIVVIATGEVVAVSAPSPIGIALVDVRVDALSALFLVALGIVGIAASVFGVGYHGHGPAGRDRTEAAFPVFLLSLALVFASGDVFAFLFAWEVMALSSAALVFGARPDAAVARAGYFYLAVTHLATAAIVVAFAVLAAAAGASDFASLAATTGTLPALGRDVVFVLLLVGFGTKAGAIPFHVWLPRAHPVAPSHVSALMSGVMIKAGIYGIVRFVLEIMGPGPEWWGIAVLAIGVVSALLGVLYALMEHDLKRLLAFHSIENIGIILIGVGVALLAAGQGATALAIVALTAALFHTLNHALFKSALFLAAGSIQAAVGHRDLNGLGGLARADAGHGLRLRDRGRRDQRPPAPQRVRQRVADLPGPAGGRRGDGALAPRPVGCAAGHRRPGPDGGAGRRLLREGDGCRLPRAPAQSRRGRRAGDEPVDGGRDGRPRPGLRRRGPRGGPRVRGDRRDRGRGRRDGAASAWRIRWQPSAPDSVAPPTPRHGSERSLLALTATTWFVGVRRRPARRAPTWTCGIVPEPAFQYTATSYAKLIRLYFGRILRPAREVTVELHPGTPFPRTVRYRGEARHVIDERLYRPIHRAAVGVAQLALRLQNGSLQLYLAYTVIAVLVLLVLAR